jgi:hypothetical protein
MREQTEKSRAYYRERGIAIRGMETEAERKEGEMKLKIVRTKSESEGGRSYMRAIILQGMRVGLGIRVDVRNETDTSICPVQSISSYHIIVLHRDAACRAPFPPLLVLLSTGSRDHNLEARGCQFTVRQLSRSTGLA